MFDYREHLHNYKKQFALNENTFSTTYCRYLHRYGLLIYPKEFSVLNGKAQITLTIIK